MDLLARESSIFSAAYLRRKNRASKEDSTFRTSALRLPSVQILLKTGAILRGGQALASDSATRKSLPIIYLHQSVFSGSCWNTVCILIAREFRLEFRFSLVPIF